MSLERAPVAGDGDGAVHELLEDWRLSALESATQGRAAPQQEQLAAGTDAPHHINCLRRR